MRWQNALGGRSRRYASNDMPSYMVITCRESGRFRSEGCPILFSKSARSSVKWRQLARLWRQKQAQMAGNSIPEGSIYLLQRRLAAVKRQRDDDTYAAICTIYN